MAFCGIHKGTCIHLRRIFAYFRGALLGLRRLCAYVRGQRVGLRRLFVGLTTTCVDLRRPSFRLREFFSVQEGTLFGERALCCPDMVLCRLERDPLWTGEVPV